MSNYNNNEFSFASSRNSGYTAYIDPDNTSSSFYRSMVAKPTLTTREITGVVGDTGSDPTAFAVPGRALVGTEGAELLGSDAQPTGTLAAGTRLRTVSRPTWMALDAVPVIEVAGLDDSSIAGFVRIDPDHAARQHGPDAARRGGQPDRRLAERRRGVRWHDALGALLRDRELDAARERCRRRPGRRGCGHRQGAGRCVERAGRRQCRTGRRLHLHLPRTGRVAERAGTGREVGHDQGRHHGPDPQQLRRRHRHDALVLAER